MMKPSLNKLSLATAAVMLLAISACSREADDAERDINLTTGNEEPAPGRLGGTMANDYRDLTVELTPYATVEFNAGDGQRTSGNAQFISEEQGVRIIGRLANLPQGEHGLRIVQSGDCTAVTGVVSARNSEIDSAVQDAGNALPDSGYVGDLSVGPDNLASFDLNVNQLELEGPNSIVGKAMIVAAAADPGNEPAEQAVDAHGNVIACGVITLNAITAADQDAPAR